MTQEFEGDLTGAVFWGADLRRAHFRDVRLDGTRMKRAWLVDVDIDGMVDRLVINGVDVTGYVNAHDPCQPLRGMLNPADRAGLVATADAMEAAWATTIAEAMPLGEATLRTSVDGEWSFVDTLRHLVFGIDKWFTAPISGGSFHPMGLPNRGSAGFGWPGVDPSADPTLAEVLAARAGRWEGFRRALDTVTEADLARTVEVLENGPVPLLDCLHVVFEEAFEHRRYALRDLATLGAG